MEKSIKKILDEIAAEHGSNKKMEILAFHKENELLKDVIYLACSKRIKFYIKQIPEHKFVGFGTNDLKWAMNELGKLSTREITGHAGIEHLRKILQTINDDNAYVIERIVSKDLKIGMASKNIEKVFKGLLEITPYQGARPYDISLVKKLLSKGPAKSQTKLDGRYQNCIVRDKDVELETRAGEQTVLTGAKFLDEISELTDEMVFNGELTVEGVPMRNIANGIINSLSDIFSKADERGVNETEKKIKEFLLEHADVFGDENITIKEVLDRIVYTCWDIISVNDYYAKESKIPYHKRFETLNKIIKDKKPTRVHVVESVEVTTFEEAMEHFQKNLKNGLEGTILKENNSHWKNGKPSHNVKFKLEMNIDLKIVGFKMGTKGTKNEHVISTLILESSCGKLKTDPSGMTEKMMADVTARQKELLGTIVEIRCCGLSQNKQGEWSTMHPSVEELRTDKKTCDSLESAIEIENAAKGLKLAK